jgi:CRISPR-associated protein Cas2
MNAELKYLIEVYAGNAPALMKALLGWVVNRHHVQEVDKFGITETIFDDNRDADQQAAEELIRTIRKDLIQKEHNQKFEASKKLRNKEALPTIPVTEDDSALPPLKDRLEAIRDIFAELPTKTALTMTYIIMYDIENNTIRARIAKFLKTMGLRRIQKSVFMGSIARPTLTRIYDTIKAIQAEYENNDSVIFMPIAADNLKSMRLIGHEIDVEYVLYSKHTVFI